MYVGPPGREPAAAQRGQQRVGVGGAGGQRAPRGPRQQGVGVVQAVVGLPRLHSRCQELGQDCVTFEPTEPKQTLYLSMLSYKSSNAIYDPLSGKFIMMLSSETILQCLPLRWHDQHSLKRSELNFTLQFKRVCPIV